MKKQILLLTFLSLAFVFAGVNKSFGQELDYVTATPDCVEAVPLTCATAFNHLNPNPGQTYNYEVETVPGTVASIHWFVTNDVNVIGTGGVLTTNYDLDDGDGDYILDAEDAVYNIPTNTTPDIDISWQYFNGATTTVLLVAYVEGANGCSDNVEVWRIEPSFSFTLDVISMFDDGSINSDGTPAEECVSPVESAIYNDPNLTMDYGENYVFFSVNAANFVDSWMPTMSAVASNGAATTITWAYPDQAILESGTWNATTVPVEASATATDGVVGATGECIVVRVLVDHGSNEAPLGATNGTVTLSIDGVMYDSANDNYTNANLADMDDDGGTCVNDVTDEADYILLPRPDINEVTPAPVSFEPKN